MSQEKPESTGSAPAGNTSPSESAAKDPKSMRAGYFENIFETIKHIRASVSSEGRKLRGSDYLSIILLPVVSVVLCLGCFALAQTEPFKGIFVAALNLVVLYFIGARFGIIRALTHRQAHLVWVLLMAVFMLGITFSLLMFELGRMVQ